MSEPYDWRMGDYPFDDEELARRIAQAKAEIRQHEDEARGAEEELSELEAEQDARKTDA